MPGSHALRITGTLVGLDEALRKTAALARVGQIKWRDAVEYVLQELRSYARRYAPFKDRTGNLRNSIDYEMAPGRSEERRVGKECRSRWTKYHEIENIVISQVA